MRGRGRQEMPGQQGPPLCLWPALPKAGTAEQTGGRLVSQLMEGRCCSSNLV